MGFGFSKQPKHPAAEDRLYENRRRRQYQQALAMTSDRELSKLEDQYHHPHPYVRSRSEHEPSLGADDMIPYQDYQLLYSQNVGLQANLNNLRISTLHDQATLNQLNNAYKILEKTLNSTTHENERLHSSNRQANAEVTSLKTQLGGDDQTREIQSLQAQLQQSKSNFQQVSGQLEACKARVFEMRPVEYATDSQIKQKYTALCKAVDDWVYRQMQDVDFLLCNINTIEWTPMQQLTFQDLLIRPGEVSLAKRFPGAELQIMVGFALCYLYDEILQPRRWVIGMNKQQEDILVCIESGMEKLKPRRDEEKIGFWRSETYHALTASRHFARLEEKALKKCAADISELFFKLRPEDKQIKSAYQNADDIVQEAYSLLKDIRGSPATYQFDNVLLANWPEDDRVLQADEVDEYKCLDVEDGSVVRKAKLTVKREDERIGEKLCCIFPELKRVNGKGKDDLVLSKAEILVSLDEEEL